MAQNKPSQEMQFTAEVKTDVKWVHAALSTSAAIIQNTTESVMVLCQESEFW